MKVAYFTNQYPKVSHAFIRREILALERQGVKVQRIALRGWADPLVDTEDVQEREQTRYVLKEGLAPLVGALLVTMFFRPFRFARTLRLLASLSRGNERPLPFHFVYLAEACRILWWLKQSDATHLHAHFGTNPAEVAQLVHALGGPPYSFTVHGPEEFDKPQGISLGMKMRDAAFIVAVSSFGRSQLFRWLPPTAWNKVQVVHCGLETAFHQDAPDTVSASPRLVCVGRLCEQKGQLLLVEATKLLAERGVEFELVLAGDGEMRAEIEQLCASPVLRQRVRITGWISSGQVRQEILSARALVLPSFAEGLPVVLMEAMSLRRPVLSTYVAGIPELVVPGETGWLFPAGCAEALADAMEACLSTPPEKLGRIGEAARARVLERHDIDVEAGRLRKLFAGAEIRFATGAKAN